MYNSKALDFKERNTPDMTMYKLDPEELTKKELAEIACYYRTIAIGQAAHISSMEEENEGLINTALKMARENDIMTQVLFESGYANKYEVTV